ncbi:MAG: ribonuclease P protein component [Bacteroidia bacterium]|nr:ribonuclease P protein component [Bacteroidia bacterium]
MPATKQRYTFSKNERLCSKKIIEELFSRGRYHVVPPLKIVWIKTELHTESPIQIVISVSKRNFKKAVDRNYIKRLIREAYRKNKHILYDYLIENDTCIAIGLIYSERELADYFEIEKKLVLLLHKLIGEYAKSV